MFLDFGRSIGTELVAISILSTDCSNLVAVGWDDVG